MTIRLPVLARPLRNHPRMLGVWKRWRHLALSFGTEPNLARPFPISDLSYLAPAARCVRPQADVAGWLSDDEGAALYLLARHSASVLEIGAWCGKSTIYLARGVLAGGREAKFVSSELAPTPANFRPVRPGVLGFYYPPESTVALSEANHDEYFATIHPIISLPGGLPAQLERNLTAAGCRSAVEFRFGDFKDLAPQPFSLVFCDATHTDAEINRNAPLLRPLLAPDGILACHDMTPERVVTLKNHFSFSEESQVDSLFVGRLRT